MLRSTCRQCGNYYQAKRPDSTTCSSKCRKAFSRHPPRDTGYYSVSQDGIYELMFGGKTDKDLTPANPPTNKWVPSGAIGKGTSPIGATPLAVIEEPVSSHKTVNYYHTCPKGHKYVGARCLQKGCY